MNQHVTLLKQHHNKVSKYDDSNIESRQGKSNALSERSVPAVRARFERAFGSNVFDILCLRSMQTAFCQTTERLLSEDERLRCSSAGGNEMMTLRLEDLDQFTGTEHWYRTTFNPNILYTDGVKYVAETGGCYWLIDTIVISQCIPKVKAEEFQTWKLIVKNSQATLVCEDGDYHKVYKEEIPFTDFPLPEITFWLTDKVIMLPSEY